MSRAEPIFWYYNTQVQVFGTDITRAMHAWLYKHVGQRGIDWNYTVELPKQQYVEERVSFTSERHKVLFDIAWSHICKN